MKRRKMLKGSATGKVVATGISLLLLLGITRIYGYRTSYSVPISMDDVASISFYYDNFGQKKIVTSSSDISLVFKYLDKIDFRKQYSRLPTGGQSFVLVFHLASGTDWVCTYFQTYADTGYYVDDTTKLSVSNFDLKKLWERLPCQEYAAFAANEIILSTR